MLNSSKTLINQNVKFGYSRQINNALHLLGYDNKPAISAAISPKSLKQVKNVASLELVSSPQKPLYDPVFNFAGDAL